MSQINLVGPLMCHVDTRPTTVVKTFVISIMLTEFSSALAKFPASHFQLLLLFLLLLQRFTFIILIGSGDF